MGLFRSEPSGFLGVDLSSDAIKIVELKAVKGKPQLITYGYTENKPDVLRGDFIENKNITSALLKEVYQKAGAKSTRAYAALPVTSVFTSILKLDGLTKKELADKYKIKTLLTDNLKNILPLPIEDMIFDFNVIMNDGIDQAAHDAKLGTVRFLITATANEVVKKYVEIFKQTGLELANLDMEPFALVRSLVGKDNALIMIADMGENRTSISIVDHGIPVYNRGINVGGGAITKRISETLSISMAEAEQYKYDLGVLVSQEGVSGLPKPIEEGLHPIVAEIKYVIKTYYEQVSNERAIDKIILTGGSASLANLAGYITKELNVNTYLGDPWARIIHPEELRPVLHEIGSRFSVAVGLAMRDIIQP